MTEWGETGGAAERRSSRESTLAWAGRDRASRLLIVGASRTDSAGPECIVGEPLDPREPTVRSTPPRAYASNSSARRSFSEVLIYNNVL